MDLDDAKTIATDLIHTHLIGGSCGWQFKFDNAKSRAGCCNYTKRTISLSRHFVALNDESEVRLTILHEIAHALTPHHNHDAVWKAKCAELGGVPATCCDSASAIAGGRNVVMAQGKWRAVCPNCKKLFHRHRRLRDGRRRWCRACGPSLGVLTFQIKGD